MEQWSKVKVAQSCPTLRDPSGILQARGIKPRSPALQADYLPAEPPGKPKNTGVASLSLLHGSSRPRNQTKLSSIAGRFFTSWATREAQYHLIKWWPLASSLPGSLTKCSPGSHLEPLTWVCLQSYLCSYILTCVSVLVTGLSSTPRKALGTK